MRTYPIVDDAGLMFALEVENAYVGPGALAQVIGAVSGVSAVQPRKPFSGSADTRVTFQYQGMPFVVMEPFGDNSRYWIGPESPEAGKVDVSALDRALKEYRPSRLAKVVGDLLSLRFSSLFQH